MRSRYNTAGRLRVNDEEIVTISLLCVVTSAMRPDQRGGAISMQPRPDLPTDPTEQ